MSGGPEALAAAWTALEDELDWPLLGRLHCHEGGDDFFGPEDRARLLDAGLLFADDLGAVLARGGRSLYVGASVAELVPMLVERLVLGREVLWYERDAPVTRELARAVDVAARATDSTLPAPCTDPLDTVPPASCDHLWLVSVLTDPEVFPALHDALYERHGDELATGGGDLGAERAAAEALARTALARLRPPAHVSTTDEELALLRPLCPGLEVPDRARLSAVVGDPVRLCRFP